LLNRFEANVLHISEKGFSKDRRQRTAGDESPTPLCFLDQLFRRCNGSKNYFYVLSLWWYS